MKGRQTLPNYETLIFCQRCRGDKAFLHRSVWNERKRGVNDVSLSHKDFFGTLGANLSSFGVVPKRMCKNWRRFRQLHRSPKIRITSSLRRGRHENNPEKGADLILNRIKPVVGRVILIIWTIHGEIDEYRLRIYEYQFMGGVVQE